MLNADIIESKACLFGFFVCLFVRLRRYSTRAARNKPNQ
jgi:hypothetical protein